MMRAAVVMGLACVACVSCVPGAGPPGGPAMDSARFVDDTGVVTPLVCPGARGCERQGGALRVGAAARAITPSLDDGIVYIAGFSLGRPATGVHDDVWVRAFVVEDGDVRVGVVVGDTIGFFHPEVMALRQAAQDAGLDLDDVVLVATHNHESKDTMGLWGASAADTGYDPAYMAFITAQATEALAEATAELEPARLVVATADGRDLVNDTRLPHVLDGTIYALEFLRADDSVIADVITWGNHPEALGGDNQLLTSDYPHFIREELEARRPGSTAIFLPGLLGGLTTSIGLNICPDADGVDACPQGTFERAEVTGRAVAARAVAALDAAIAAGAIVDAPAVASRRLPVMLTPRTLTLGLAFQVGLITRPLFYDDGVPVEDAAVPLLSLDDITAGALRLDSEVGALAIGDVEFTFIPGELYSELWLVGDDGEVLLEEPAGGDFPDAATETPLLAVARPAKTRIVVNQANDAVGYLIPQRQWDVEAPRAYEEGGQYGEQNSLGHTAAAEVVDAVIAAYALAAR